MFANNLHMHMIIGFLERTSACTHLVRSELLIFALASVHRESWPMSFMFTRTWSCIFCSTYLIASDSVRLVSQWGWRARVPNKREAPLEQESGTAVNRRREDSLICMACNFCLSGAASACL